MLGDTTHSILIKDRLTQYVKLKQIPLIPYQAVVVEAVEVGEVSVVDEPPA